MLRFPPLRLLQSTVLCTISTGLIENPLGGQIQSLEKVETGKTSCGQNPDRLNHARDGHGRIAEAQRPSALSRVVELPVLFGCRARRVKPVLNGKTVQRKDTATSPESRFAYTQTTGLLM